MWNYNNVIIILPGYKPLYAKVSKASKTTNVKSHIPTTPITCLPFSFPFLAPSVIPGASNAYNLLPLYRKTPGIHIKVVNSLFELLKMYQLMYLVLILPCSLLNFSIFAFNKPRWVSMTLFFGPWLFLLLFLLSIGPHSFFFEIKYFYK